MKPASGVKAPFSLMVELTHRCPLHCVYCSNPLQMDQVENELSTEAWLSVIDQAADMGVLQLHFSGGEPIMRRDFLTLLERANERELFTNLITSGIGVTDAMLERLVELNLGSFQLSFQGSDEAMVQEVAGGPFWKKKMEIGRKVRDADLSLSINTVLHRKNLHQVGDLIELSAELGAERLELANTQYAGWALLNRDQLLPTRAQLEQASAEVEAKRERYGDRMEIIWVVPDYFDDFPKPCMGGWGDSLFSLSPDGTIMPCLSARVIPGLELPNARQHDLRWAWYESPAFNAFRGHDWMQEPCSSCPMRFQDHGGCRCQAMMMTGDPNATDPACIYSPHRHEIDEARAKAEAQEAPAGEAQYRRLEGPAGD
ncbi:MAG: pyrroloquinoline quinone biosynthesis protein PqqE [Trueperaceae bacterium]|nr:pyrroloquinoline quinone biosynthesis protein PqqE [Trueperaceae bacterium]